LKNFFNGFELVFIFFGYIFFFRRNRKVRDMKIEEVYKMTIEYYLTYFNDWTMFQCQLDNYRTYKEPFCITIWNKKNNDERYVLAIEPSSEGVLKFYDFVKSVRKSNDIIEPLKKYNDWFCSH
jgi:hypothetical protein